MALDIEVEFSDEMLKSYTNYDKSTFEFCTKLLEDVKTKRGETAISDTTIDDAIHLLLNKQLPRFRFVNNYIYFHISLSQIRWKKIIFHFSFNIFKTALLTYTI